MHWGFVPCGVSKDSELLESVKDFAPMKIKSICIKGRNARKRSKVGINRQL